MRHLEVVTDTTQHISGDEANIRSWAAHYLIQSVAQNSKPDNFDEVVAEARTLDVLREAMGRH